MKLAPAMAVTALTLSLAGCAAQADSQSQAGNQQDYRTILSAVDDVMCARTDHERELAAIRLARAAEAYQGEDGRDTASGVVEGAVGDFYRRGCPTKNAAQTP